jgi:L-threonylcarbamoyladenylate synthase
MGWFREQDVWYISLFTRTIFTQTIFTPILCRPSGRNQSARGNPKIHAVTPEASLIKYAAEQIQAGQVLGMPTDTFYGLAADPFNLRAVERVYEIKSRLKHKPLSLLIENVDQAEEFARPLPDDFHLLARRFWPGPLTMIVPAASHLPLKVTANTGNVALRVPASEIPLAVVRAAKIPITATSANLSGATECTTAERCGAITGSHLADRGRRASLRGRFHRRLCTSRRRYLADSARGRDSRQGYCRSIVVSRFQSCKVSRLQPGS